MKMGVYAKRMHNNSAKGTVIGKRSNELKLELEIELSISRSPEGVLTYP